MSATAASNNNLNQAPNSNSTKRFKPDPDAPPSDFQQQQQADFQQNNEQQPTTTLDTSTSNNNTNDTNNHNNNAEMQHQQNEQFAGSAGKNNAANQQQQGSLSKSKRVYVANVPFDVKWSELKDLFREKIGNVTYCTIFENEEGKSRGCGLVEFQDPESARVAIEVMHRSEFKNRELVVKEDLDCERDRFGRIITSHGGSSRMRDDSQRRDGANNDRSERGEGRGGGGGERGGGGRGERGGGGRNQHQQQQMQQQQQQHLPNDSYGYDHSVMSNAFGPAHHHNTYGLSLQFLDSLGISMPLNNRIFVANLEYKVDQNKLEEIFKLAGKVAKVKLSHDAQGQSRGYGTVEYEHPVEAVQAISMFHNQKLYGRTMSVRMDKYECEDDLEALPSKLPTGLESIGKGLGVGGQPLNIARSIMNATLVAPPHLGTPGQPIPQMHQAVQQPAAMQQAVIAAQMQQLQQQQQQHHQHHQQPQPQPPHAAVGQNIQQALPPTMQHQLQQSLQQPMHQQYQIHQMSQPTPQALQAAGVQAAMPGVQAYSTLQQLQSGSIRPQTASVYQQPQQPPQQPQQSAATQPPQQPTSSTPAANLSVYSTFERQFREASAPQSFTRN